MAAGNYKNGVAIGLVYQAAALLSNAIPEAIVYDEGDALDTAKSTSLTSSLLAGELSGLALGSYRGTWTPDAEGIWTVIIEDKNNAGQVSKTYNVAGHDMDSVGDAVAGLGAGGVASQLIIHETGMNSQVLALLDGVESSVVSQLIIHETGMNSQILVLTNAVETGVASQLLLTKSTLVSSILADDLSSELSDVESAVNVAISAIATVSSPGMIS